MLAAGTLDSVSPALAALAGLASFVSPCVLPLVPAYLAYLGARAGRVPVAAGAVEAEAPRQLPVVIAGVGFVAGLSLVFILFFYLFSLAVQPIRSYIPAVAGVLVLVMAAHVAGVIHIPFLDREYRLMDRAPAGGGLAGGFLLGMGFASGWTPCIGVTLGAVLSSAVTAGTSLQGLGLMLAYCLGLGVPFIALALLLERARPLVQMLNSHRRAIDIASSAVLVAMGFLLLTNQLALANHSCRIGWFRPGKSSHSCPNGGHLTSPAASAPAAPRRRRSGRLPRATPRARGPLRRAASRYAAQAG